RPELCGSFGGGSSGHAIARGARLALGLCLAILVDAGFPGGHLDSASLYSQPCRGPFGTAAAAGRGPPLLCRPGDRPDASRARDVPTRGIRYRDEVSTLRMNQPDPLSSFLPAVRKWFQNTLGEPTPAQRLGWPSIRAGQNTLILAPTGSGKTLAAFLACLDDL